MTTTPQQWPTADDTRDQAIAFGAPIFVPGPSFVGEWYVNGVATTNDGVPVHVSADARSGRDRLRIQTSTDELYRNMHVIVSQLLARSVPDAPPLPLTVTVSEREVTARVDDEVVSFRLIETEVEWRATTALDGRVVVVAGRHAAFNPDEFTLARVTDVAALPRALFR